MKLVLHLLPGLSFFASETGAFAQTNIDKIAASYNAFGLKLLAQTRQSVPGKMSFLSPAGLAFALSMVADGARGRNVAADHGGFASGPWRAELNEANEALLATFDLAGFCKSNWKLPIACGLAQDTAISAGFLAVLRKSYQAEAASVDFKNPATAQKINDWVQRTYARQNSTHGSRRRWTPTG